MNVFFPLEAETPLYSNIYRGNFQIHTNLGMKQGCFIANLQVALVFLILIKLPNIQHL